MKNQEVNANNTAENNGVISGSNTGTIENHIHYHNGMSPQDAVQQSLALFQSNFLILEKAAADTARARVDEIVNELFTKIAQNCPNKFESFSDPDIQCNLIEIEKAYARSGKAELKETLTGLLVHRVQSDNDLVSICLNEAIKLVPSLTTAQLDLLSIRLLVGYSYESDVTDINSLVQYIDTHLLPFVQCAEPSQKDAAHLISFRCGFSPVDLAIPLGIALAKNYPSAFNFVKKSIVQIPDAYSNYIIRMDNGGQERIDQYIISRMPLAARLFHYYDGWLFNFGLTSLGKLIGAINAEIKVGEKFDLSIMV
jgi:hypothetical protein